MTVVESGFASLDLPEALREDEWKGNLGGWQYELAGLRTRAEQGTRDPPTRAGCSPRSPTRAGASCSSCSRSAPARRAGALAAGLPVSRQAVAQHLAVLEEARLVSRAAGRASGAVHRPDRTA